jgi:hypothetical protein
VRASSPTINCLASLGGKRTRRGGVEKQRRCRCLMLDILQVSLNVISKHVHPPPPTSRRTRPSLLCRPSSKEKDTLLSRIGCASRQPPRMNALTYYSELADWVLNHVTDSNMFYVQSVVTCTALVWFVSPSYVC